MNSEHIKSIAGKLNLQDWQVENTLKLWSAGGTIPFISRYRKEATGSLDEMQIAGIIDLHKKLEEFEARRQAIIKSVTSQEKMTDDLMGRIMSASVLSELEDIYLPYRPKKKTRAMIARSKGLEPLAADIISQGSEDPEVMAGKYVNEDVETVEEALQGARDIIAEMVSEDKRARDAIRTMFSSSAVIISKVVKGMEPNGIKYGDYYDFSEPLSKCPSHRLLAMLRAEQEGILKVDIRPDEEKAVSRLNAIFIKSRNKCTGQISEAIADSYKRLLKPSIENEVRSAFKEIADKHAIQVFAENLRQLLMAPPLGKARVLAIDPGYRTGCKVVCLDEQGNLLHNETIFPHPPQNETRMAAKKISTLVNSYKIDAIAIGNGTAGRETEYFIRNIKFDKDIKVVVVSEAGASVYSASKAARDEFPDYDVTVRGAVSIGRRLIDPLAELVKIDPKSIGVGQYQHDVDQIMLKESLDQVVESCVNAVGVDLNTASTHLLTYVSGIGPSLAQKICDYRAANGYFGARKDLLKVPRMGEKAFEQSAGFLRIRDGINPLDNSAVHPESYFIVERMAKDLGKEVPQIINTDLSKDIDIKKYVGGNIGIPTLTDILTELAKPGRDPRKSIKILEFSKDIRSIDDVKPGMVLPGIVMNITGFGAFVDIGIKENGLVHVSQMADKYVSNPLEILKLHQHLKVKVLEVDSVRKRIALTLKGI